MPAASLDSLASRLKSRALDLGFDAVGVARVEPMEDRLHLERWLEAGRHGGMAYMARNAGKRGDPRRVLEDCRSVVCVALCYGPDRDAERDLRLGRIARYAVGEDYHAVMGGMLEALWRWIRAEVPGARGLWYVDTGPVLERAWAQRAGLGWIGKHSGLLSTRLGSWLLLGEILLDLDLPADRPATAHCGTCTRCITACPTGAIVAPYQVDARLCISYLTIELRGPIPRELRPLVGDHVFGCDLCQDVCPWNRFARAAREARLAPLPRLREWTLERMLTLDEQGFRRLFAGSPIRRAGRAGLLRNVCVALGNRHEAAAVPALVTALRRDPEPLVRGHAAWALGEIAAAGGEAGAARAALGAALGMETDPWVREEAGAALARATG